MEPRGLFGRAGNGLENVYVNKSPPRVPFLPAARSPLLVEPRPAHSKYITPAG